MSIIDPPLAGGTARRLDQVGRGLLGLLALSTVYAFVDGLRLVAAAGDDRLWVEFWRTTAYLVFAGLFAMLAVAPRTRWGVWELVFAQKLAVTVFGLANFGVNEARRDATTDLVLVVVMAIAYVLCRGWHTWRSPEVGAGRTMVA
jgi:peptidoglycan/LPS O-acetylase OafA/YrhL